ncbi:MAG: hypothetical protein RSD67_02425 [Oscillospiraceae bacterium]
MATKTVLSQYYCIGCERMIDTKEFWLAYGTLHKGRQGRLFYCKKCCKRIADEIFSKYSSYELCCREMCTVMFMPYVQEACDKLKEYEFTTVKSDGRDFSRVYQYGSFLKDLGMNEEKYWDNLSGNSFLGLNILKEKSLKLNKESDCELLLYLEEIWGKQPNIDAYLWLEEKFSQYADGEILSPAMTNLIRYLCAAELDVYNLKNARAEQKEISFAEERVSKYYAKLKLDDFKFNNAKSETEKLLENWIYIQENIEPLDWEAENLKDRLGIDKDYDNIMRSLGNKVSGSRDYPKLTLDDVKRGKKK